MNVFWERRFESVLYYPHLYDSWCWHNDHRAAEERLWTHDVAKRLWWPHPAFTPSVCMCVFGSLWMAQGINQAKSSSSLCASVWSSGSVLTDGPDLRWSTCLFVSGTNPSAADHGRPLHHSCLHTSHWGGVFVYLPGGNKNYFSAKSSSLHHFFKITDGIINCVSLNKSHRSNICGVYRCAELHLTPALKVKMGKVRRKAQIKNRGNKTRRLLSAPGGCTVASFFLLSYLLWTEVLSGRM